ncbi:protein LEG1 homolog [Syngnathoides biaculeatus]|uniref:protein LEG1 homolog n=1 Tax=Syngnathoides biaculeatus TaxID=300417 RepID=UPI002ADD3DB1|nr:protein LEG1 homolog [Syngnathoides biaculeatus]XP_061668200.1 protein LEG1 homolog [Syngnathoides biaculeatus]
MQRLAASCLALALAASVAHSAVILENGAPIKWAQAAAQLSDLPVENGVLNPNPWDFVHRMGFYRLLIAATDPFMGSMGAGPTESPVWGLPLQFGWMLTSGRLADPTGATTCGLQTGDTTCISPQSWWGCVNHFVSALPFLSAAQQEIFGQGVQVQMQAPEGAEGYCTTYADCAAKFPDVMAKWDAFFKGLKASGDSTLPDNEKKDAILGLYWDAHMASLHAASACSAKQSSYSAPEVNFASSWLNSAEYVSAASFQSSLEKSVVFLTPLPGRILQEGDSAPNIADMTQEENHTLSTFSWMMSMGGAPVRMWRSAMCSVANREKGREMLEQLLLNPSLATTTFLSIITGMMTGC